MNYGMGGIISAHVDAFGLEENSKIIEEGGPRIMASNFCNSFLQRQVRKFFFILQKVISKR